MDDQRFDDLARAIAYAGVSRRQVLRTLAAGALGSVVSLLGRGAAALGDPCAGVECDPACPCDPNTGQCVCPEPTPVPTPEPTPAFDPCAECDPDCSCESGECDCPTPIPTPDPCGDECDDPACPCDPEAGQCVCPADPCADVVCDEEGCFCDPDLGECVCPTPDRCDECDPDCHCDPDAGECVCPDHCRGECEEGEICDEGDCVCHERLTRCDGVCVDTDTDVNNCGRCGNRCDEGESCDDGTCADDDPTPTPPVTRCDDITCSGPGLRCCDDSCQDIGIDTDHCGDCGVPCGVGQYCGGGICRYPEPTPVPAPVERFLVLLDSFLSSSLTLAPRNASDPDNHTVRDDFGPILAALTGVGLSPRVVYFSYRVGALLKTGEDQRQGWDGRSYEDAREPVYWTSDTTDHSLADHVAGLDWLIRDLLARYPGSTVDLVGHGLGGIVALVWVGQQPPGTAGPLAAIGHVVLLDSPVGGFNPAATVAATAADRVALRERNFDLATRRVMRDLLSTNATIAEFSTAADRVNIASIDNSEDYLVNATLIPKLDLWLGRGARAAELMPEERRYEFDLGGSATDLFDAHRRILTDVSDEAATARQLIAQLLLT